MSDFTTEAPWHGKENHAAPDIESLLRPSAPSLVPHKAYIVEPGCPHPALLQRDSGVRAPRLQLHTLLNISVVLRCY